MEAPIPGSERGDAVPAVRGSAEPVAAEAPAVLVPPRYGPAWRALFAFVGLAIFFVAGVLALSGGWMALVLAVLVACLGGMMGYFAVTGREPDSARLYPSRRFAELADPTRPLAPEDLRLPPAESTLTDPPGAPAQSDDPGTTLERLP